MANKNNFQRLDDEQLSNRNEQRIEQVRHDVDGSVSFIQMVGRIVEVYLPRVFEVFMLMGGADNMEEGKDNRNTNDNDNTPPSAGGSGNFRDLGPKKHHD